MGGVEGWGGGVEGTLVTTVITTGWHNGTSTVRSPLHGSQPFFHDVSPLRDGSSAVADRSWKSPCRRRVTPPQRAPSARQRSVDACTRGRRAAHAHSGAAQHAGGEKSDAPHASTR